MDERHTELEADQKLKRDAGKLRWDLLPLGPMKGIVEVLTFGLNKGYKEDSWKQVDPKRYEAALWRHWYAVKSGEEIDPESGLPHMYHFLCNAMFLTYLKED